jgi:hypothetical protein
MSMESYGGMISTGEHSRFVHQRSLAILEAELSRSKAGGTGEENYKFGLSKFLCSYLKRIFNML